MVWVKPQHEIERGIRNRFEFALAIATVTEDVCKVARELAAPSRRSGDYQDHISATLRGDGKWSARASSEHAAPIEGGTGLYGPRHQPVRAAVGKKFKITLEDGTVLELTEQKGTKPKHIMEHAAELIAVRSEGLTFRRHHPWKHVPD